MALKGSRLPSRAGFLSSSVSTEFHGKELGAEFFAGRSSGSQKSPKLLELCLLAEKVGSRTERTFRAAQCHARLPGEAVSGWHSRVGSGSQKWSGTCVLPLATEHFPLGESCLCGDSGPSYLTKWE